MSRWRHAVSALLADLRSAGPGRALVHIGIPAVLVGALMAMYFSGRLFLQRIISPKLPPVPIDSWRELGLLEGLQILLLMAMLVVAVCGAVRGRGADRLLFVFIATATVFVLVEEVDYGSHHARYLSEPQVLHWLTPEREWPAGMLETAERPVAKHGLHYWQKLEEKIKVLANLIVIVLFVWLPIRVRRPDRSPRWAVWLAPHPMMMLTVGLMLLARQLAHSLGRLDERLAAADPTREIGSIDYNLSEFGELLTYYAFLVYIIDLVRRMRASGNPGAP